MSAFEQGTRDDTATTGGDVKERAVETVAEVDAGAKYVAGVAADEAVDTARDAKEAARGFFEETRTELASQASTQQRRAANALRGTGDELESLAAGSSTSGAATRAVRTLGQQTRQAADWLEQREPADVVREVRSFARRHTVAFVVGALAVGIVAGRVTRALMSDAQHDASGADRTGAARTGATATRPAGTGSALTGAGATAGRAPGSAAALTTDDTPIGDALAGDGVPGQQVAPGSGSTTAGAGTAASQRDAWSPSGEERP